MVGLWLSNKTDHEGEVFKLQASLLRIDEHHGRMLMATFDGSM